jgi:hypothetical protein
MPPGTNLGRHLRAARLTFYQRLADRLEAAGALLDHDPEVTADGDYICFADQRLHSPLGADYVRKHGG